LPERAEPTTNKQTKLVIQDLVANTVGKVVPHPHSCIQIFSQNKVKLGSPNLADKLEMHIYEGRSNLLLAQEDQNLCWVLAFV
jgi:hypothetical protein